VKRKRHLFKLKGERKYVHGTDIFDQFIKDFSGDVDRITDLEFTFSSRLQNTACIWCYSDDEAELASQSAPCRGKYILDGKQYFFTLAPDDEQGSRSRFAYNEDEVTAQARLTNTTSTITVNSKYSFIENLVALNKLYHVQNYELKDKQWMLAKISLQKIPGDVAKIELQDDSMILGRLSKRKIIADDENIGFIFFSTA
jgi:hypothetical protein